MARYIDVEAMIKRLEKWNTSNDMDKALYNFALNRIIEQPTADVVEVVHGYWIDAYPEIEPNPMFAYGICSVCGFEQSISNTLAYCPNCGAKMDGKKVE